MLVGLSASGFRMIVVSCASGFLSSSGFRVLVGLSASGFKC